MEHASEVVAALAREQGWVSRLRQRAAAVGARVALPEGDDPRVLAAAIALRELGIATPILIGAESMLRNSLSHQGVDPGAFSIIDPTGDNVSNPVAERLFDRRRSRGLSQGEASVLSKQPLQLGAGLVAMGKVDAMVAGAAHATAEIIRAGLWHVGLADGVDLVSGSFLMVPATGPPRLFADAAVVPVPTDDELVSIGVASAQTYERLTGESARVACLSFSTKGSANHPSATRMARVAERLTERGWRADGELQFDAAVVPIVGDRKAAGSEVAGRANVLIFPDLNAGNIAYKVAERWGGHAAIGPLVQGLARPIFDLSRGCSAADIVNTVSIASLFLEETPRG